jgi:hypothetical protein
VQSKEAAGNGDDAMTITLRAPDGSVIGPTGAINSAAPRNVWKQEILQFNVSGYSAPTATLSFVGQNDAKNVSSFFIDDVSLLHECAVLAGATSELADATALVSDTQALSNTTLLPAVMGDSADSANEPVKTLAPAACSNLLLNGSFETASAGPAALPWSGLANTPSTIYNVIPNSTSSSLKDDLVSTARSHSGFRSGRVGSPTINGYWTELVQTVALPAGVASLQLTYWRYLDTSETSTTVSYDRFEVGLETERGVQIVAPQKIDNRDGRRGQWVQEVINVPNPTVYSGRSIWVTFKGNTDNTLPSSFLVDDVELSVCANG